MKLSLKLEPELYDSVYSELISKGIEIDDEAELILTSVKSNNNYLLARDSEKDERVHVPISSIISIESFGHTLWIYAEDKTYSMNDTLINVLSSLDSQEFIRISNSVIISKKKIKSIKPSLSQKYVIKMDDDRVLDVTRSFYSAFRKEMNI